MSIDWGEVKWWFEENIIWIPFLPISLLLWVILRIMGVKP